VFAGLREGAGSGHGAERRGSPEPAASRKPEEPEKFFENTFGHSLKYFFSILKTRTPYFIFTNIFAV
jgi:hypothetical protein